jgi:hypothetical protein
VNQKHLEELIAVGEHDRIFPLFTREDLAQRWGKKRTTVHELSKTRPDFPKPIIGIFKSEVKPYYPLFEVERFEREYKQLTEGKQGRKLELKVTE